MRDPTRKIGENASVVTRERYVTQYPDPIAFREGDGIAVGKPDPEQPGWYWCRGPDGREGWVHESYLSQREGLARGVEDYSARELDVEPGERGRVVRIRGGWAYVALASGREGWLPAHVLRSVER